MALIGGDCTDGLPKEMDGCVTPWEPFWPGGPPDSNGLSPLSCKEGRSCRPFGCLEDVDGGEHCIAGSVSAGDRKDVGMVYLRRTGEIAALSSRLSPGDLLREGDAFDLELCRARRDGPSVTALEALVSEGSSIWCTSFCTVCEYTFEASEFSLEACNVSSVSSFGSSGRG